MNKSIVLALLIAFTTNVYANSQVCDFSVDYNIKADGEKFVFAHSKGKEVIFTKNKLFIEGNQVQLTQEQQLAHKGFYLTTKKTLPKIAEVAIEGAEIGVKAASIVVASLFGNDQEVKDDLVKPMEKMSEKVRANISSSHLNTENLSLAFDKEFDAEIAKMVEKATTKYSGRLITSLMNSIFSKDNEETKDFEFRMETLEYDVETYVENQAEALEAKADALCQDIEKLAEYDQILESHDEYPAQGLIYRDSNQGLKISNFY